MYKIDMEEPKVYCGCMPSVLDGTEKEASFDEMMEMPDEFTWEGVMPPVRNQGTTQTCVCQSLTGVLDYLQNCEDGVSNRCNNYPIQTLYSQRSNRPKEGMSIKEAMHYLYKQGLNGRKINGYAKIKSVDDLRKALLMFGPCVGGLPCYTADFNYFWRKGGKFCGGHCITFVGYTKTGIIIRNSWGEKWGKNGYLEMPYKEFPSSCFEAWTVLL